MSNHGTDYSSWDEAIEYPLPGRTNMMSDEQFFYLLFVAENVRVHLGPNKLEIAIHSLEIKSLTKLEKS